MSILCVLLLFDVLGIKSKFDTYYIGEKLHLNVGCVIYYWCRAGEQILKPTNRTKYNFIRFHLYFTAANGVVRRGALRRLKLIWR